MRAVILPPCGAVATQLWGAAGLWDTPALQPCHRQHWQQPAEGPSSPCVTRLGSCLARHPCSLPGSKAQCHCEVLPSPSLSLAQGCQVITETGHQLKRLALVLPYCYMECCCSRLIQDSAGRAEGLLLVHPPWWGGLRRWTELGTWGHSTLFPWDL